MPMVPNYGGQQAAPSSNAGTPFAENIVQNAEGQQLQQAGQAMQQAGGAAANIYDDMMQQNNQVLAMAGMNTLRQYGTDLTEGTPSDPSSGFLAKKGAAALKSEDGLPPSEHYANKLQSKITEVSGSLNNDAQRRMFMQAANDYSVQFSGRLQTHMLNEHTNYQINQYQGAVKIAADQAEKDWSNSDGINKGLPGADGQLVPGYLQQVKSAATEFFRLKGVTGTALDAELAPIVSAVQTKIITAALQNGDVTYAVNYLGVHKGDLTADDTLKVTGLVSHKATGQSAENAVQGASVKLRNQIQPTDMDTLKNIRDQLESGGRDFNADGSPVTSSAGAKYKNQVMPSTAKNPGFGIVPAKDDSPAEYNRVGDDTLEALVKKYGNPAQAMAAYNAGFGNVDKAIADATKAGAPGKWLDALAAYQSPANHAKTVRYVSEAVSKLNSGSGAPAFPTASAFVQSAIETLGPNPRMEQVKMTRELAMAQYTVLDKSRKEQGEQVVQQAQRELIQNGGSFAALSPQSMAAVTRYAPEKMDDLALFSKRIAKGENITNMGAFNFAMENPEALAKMSISDFSHFQVANFSTVDQEKIANIRADELNGKTDTSAGMLNNKVFNATVNNRIASIGVLEPADKSKQDAYEQQVGSAKKYLADDILAQQQQTGKKFTQAEIIQRIDQVITQDVKFKNTALGGYGWSQPDSYAKLFSMDATSIPEGSMLSLKKDFANKNIPNPTNDQLLRYYWFQKSKGNL